MFFILIFPLVRWIQRPGDALATCAPPQWRIRDDGRLACGHGRSLTALERLSVGVIVDANELTGEDWRHLVGRSLAGRLEVRRERDGRICRWRLSELADELPEQILRRLPDNLGCGPTPAPGAQDAPSAM